MTDAAKPNLHITSLREPKHSEAITRGAALLMRAAGIDANDETVRVDGSNGTFSIDAPGARAGFDRPEIGTANRNFGYQKPIAAKDVLPSLARGLASEALRMVCSRELRGMKIKPGTLPPAWAMCVDFDLALALKLEGKHPKQLHAGLARKWGKGPDKYPRDRGKWHAGRRIAQGVERYGVDADLPDWPGISGELDDHWSYRWRRIRMHMLDFGDGSYMSARRSYTKISLPRELSDEEVARLGDGIGLTHYVKHPFVRSRRLMIAAVARSKKRTTITLSTASAANGALKRDGYTPFYTSVRIAEPPPRLVERAKALAGEILAAAGLEGETVELKPFADGMAFADVKPDDLPLDGAEAEAVVGPTRLAAGIKKSFLKHMAKGEEDPWESVARDVAAMMREAGIFLGPNLMEMVPAEGE